MPEDNWSSFVVAGESRDVQLSRRRRHLSSSAIQSAVKRPRWSLAFDPINQVVFWSDAVTGLIGAEDSRAGRSLGLVANLTEVFLSISRNFIHTVFDLNVSLFSYRRRGQYWSLLWRHDLVSSFSWPPMHSSPSAELKPHFWTAARDDCSTKSPYSLNAPIP